VADELMGVRVAFVVANEGIEQVELTEPWKAVVEAGGRPALIAPRSGQAQAMHHFDMADRFPVDRITESARADDYDAVVLPGGIANPELLRQDAPAVDFIMSMFEKGKPVAALCHGPRTLIDGDLVYGRTVTSEPSMQTDLRNAGAIWVDEDVKVCRNGINVLITGRKPTDLKAFCREMTHIFSEPPMVA
jgi:protease I